MPKNVYGANVLTGGGTGALDAIDGADLADLDVALVVTLENSYLYSLDADSAAAESSPTVISPDSNAGDKRWILTIPSQPAFMAFADSSQTDIAVGSQVTITFVTEIYDIGSNFASNAFTAPITSKYSLIANLRADNADTASAYYQIRIVTSNRYYAQTYDLSKLSGDPAYWIFNMSVIADMDAADTAYVSLTQESGTQQTDINLESYFCGALVA